MLWVTRRGCRVGRTACVWLIRRFVDGELAFFFEDPAEAPAEAPEGAKLFDATGPGSLTMGAIAPSRLSSTKSR